jgi:hypothetical protein
MNMPIITIAAGAILCVLGLFGYFGSASENPSLTALIPFFFGDVLVVCGIIARNPRLRMHVMHAAVLVGLVGFLAAGGRVAMKWSTLFSDDPNLDPRAVRMAFLMALVSLIYVIVCIASFIAARRRRKAGEATPS